MVDHTPSNLDLSCPPLQNFYNINDIRLEKFKKVVGKYEIKPEYCLKLRQLEGFEIVFLCDDSGSMSTIIDDTNPFGKKMSRWDELKNIVNVTMEIATALDRNGIDIYFLNREPLYNVNDSLLVEHIFDCGPKGYTPLVSALNRIYKEKEKVINERKMLLIIATDGEPTNEYNFVDINDFINCLENRPKNIYVSIVACTDDKKSIYYLNDIDKEIKNVDVNDDYNTELMQIKKVQGTKYKFSFGDYITKIMLGPIDSYFDNLDEKRDKGCIIL